MSLGHRVIRDLAVRPQIREPQATLVLLAHGGIQELGARPQTLVQQELLAPLARLGGLDQLAQPVRPQTLAQPDSQARLAQQEQEQPARLV